MPRGVSLGVLVEETLLESSFHASPNAGVSFREHVKHHIRGAQAQFWMFDWSFLCGDEENGMFEVLTVAGERVYDLPDDLDPASVKQVFYRYNGAWTKLCRGIVPGDYTAQDGDDVNVTNEPALKWEFRAGTTFEIWPRSAANDSKIRFQGKKKLSALTADGDTSPLESRILVLYAASKLLRRKEPEEAKSKMDEALDMYHKLRHADTLGYRATMAKVSEPNPAADPNDRIIAVVAG